MKIEKLIVVIITIVLAIIVFPVTVFASGGEDMDSAEMIEKGKKYSGSTHDGERWYKFYASEGIIKININLTTKNSSIHLVQLFDDDGGYIDAYEWKATVGKISNPRGDINVHVSKDSGKFKGYATYKVNEEGIYYIRICCEDIIYTPTEFSFSVSDSEENFSYSNSANVSSSSNATIKINMEVGDKIDLSAMSGNKEVNAKWSSSNSKIAKVSSKGKITALKEGSCTITWTSSSSKFTIYVEVE